MHMNPYRVKGPFLVNTSAIHTTGQMDDIEELLVELLAVFIIMHYLWNSIEISEWERRKPTQNSMNHLQIHVHPLSYFLGTMKSTHKQ
jgi:hypothetical protein